MKYYVILRRACAPDSEWYCVTHALSMFPHSLSVNKPIAPGVFADLTPEEFAFYDKDTSGYEWKVVQVDEEELRK